MPLASPRPDERARQFVSTRWTMVLAAGNSQLPSQMAASALAELCRIYWRPLYLFLRREGLGSEDAQDLTQSFFADLLRDRSFRRAERERGRFRSFLLGALKHFLADWRESAQALKRGGGQVREIFDEHVIAEAEAQIAHGSEWNVCALYDRAWAAALLEQTLARLAEECALAGRSVLFGTLRPYLAGVHEGAIPYDALSQQLRRNAVTLRSDVARLRSRHRAILREEVRGTVLEDNDVDEELRYLCHVLAGS